jgi:hypothetical protein
MESYAQETIRVLPDSVSFVAALLVEFPEFAGAAFDPRTGTVRLTLLVGRRLPARGRLKFVRRLEDSIAVLHELQGGPPPRAEVRWQTGPNFTRFELVRSVEDLTVEEVRVVAQLARETFGTDLLAGEANFEEGREEELRYALEHARHLRPTRPVVGLREGGRVLVYYARRPRERMP